MATPENASTPLSQGITGLPPGLLIQSNDLSVLPEDSVPKPIVVAPYYLDGLKTELERLRARAKTFTIQLGGLLDGISIPAEASIIDGSGINAYAFDAFPYDKRIDSIYLNHCRADIPLASVLGFRLNDIEMKLDDLSNHPTLIQLTGKQAPTWLGRATITARSVTIPTLPQLTFKGAAEGADAIRASYDLNSGDLSLAVAKAELQSNTVELQITDSELNFLNRDQSVSLSGRGTFRLNRFSPDPLTGEIQLSIAGGTLRSARATLKTETPLSGLALSGSLSAAYDHSTKTGSLKLDQAQLLGIGVEGSLTYSKKMLRGALALNNLQLNALTFGNFSLVPISGKAVYHFASSTSSHPGGSVDFKDVTVALEIGNQPTRFTGDLSLSLDQRGTPSLTSASLTLASDLPVNLAGFNVVLKGTQASAPTRLSLQRVGETLVPSLSGEVQFTDLNQLNLILPEGGLTYGKDGQGWDLNEVSLNFADQLDLGSARIGSNAFVRYQPGLLTVSPDLSINLDAVDVALRPIGKLVNRYVKPVTAPVIEAFKADIDLLSMDSIRSSLDQLKSTLGIDLPAAWRSLVAYLEDYPGNPYKDSRLTVGELLDFTAYQGYRLVSENPTTAKEIFQSVFNTSIPDWLAELPQGIDYATISLAASISRMERLNAFATNLLQTPVGTTQWLSLPFALQLRATATTAEFVGGNTSKQQLLATLAPAEQRLQQLEADGLNPGPRSEASLEVTTLPLQFKTDLVLPMLDDPLASVLAIINNQPFDLVRADVALSSGVALGYGLPMATVAAPVPLLAAALQAVNATMQLRAGLNATAAFSLGLTTTAETLGHVLDQGQELSENVDRIIGGLSGADAAGRDLGLYVSQSPMKPMLKLEPWLQAGMALGRFGLSAEAYGRLQGRAEFTLNDRDGDGRLYVNDLLTGTASLPGVSSQVNLATRVGVKYDSWLGGSDLYTDLPLLSKSNLLVAQERSLTSSISSAEAGWIGANTGWAAV